MLSDILKRQFSSEEHLPPYNYHVRDSIVSLADGRTAFIIRCAGVPFEITSAGVLENQYDSLNQLFLTIGKTAGSRLMVWCYLNHYKTRYSKKYKFEHEWMQNFSDKYMGKFENFDTFENSFYCAFVLKPGPNNSMDECVEELEELQRIIVQTLSEYECEVLKTYEHNDNLYSEFYEFIAYLYNGFWERVPVTSLPLSDAIQTSTLHHSYKTIETRFPDGGRIYSQYFDLKDFPEPTTRGKLNPLLELPFSFILCLSFTYINVAESIRKINQSLNKLKSAGDEAVEQMEEMIRGKGALSSGQILFGEFHAALVVHGNSEKQIEDHGTAARTTLSGTCATLFVPATFSAPETFFSMFPGNVKRRPRPMPKTTRNLLGLFSMNTYSSGKQHGNPLGDGEAVMPLKTTAHGVYHFNFHYSMPHQDARGEKRAGHTCILGATGVGKTTLQVTMLSFLTRFDTQIFAIDKDGSMRGFIESHGGTYFRLTSGEPTGLNPFQLPDTPMNRSFLYDLVEACGRGGISSSTAEDVRDIKRAVDNLYELPFEQRRFGVIIQSIPDRGEDCLVRRLSNWCYGEIDGRFAYALDNPTNNFDWEHFHKVGFDVSDFLMEGHPATEPILAYLFHLKSLMTKRGGGLVTVVEEFWLPLSFPTTANQILDSLKTGRRRDEFIVLVTQSPEDAIKSPLLPAILQQTPTKIYLPNPDAEYSPNDGGGYVRFGLNTKEFHKLKSLGQQSRMFLIKQGSQSSLARLDLTDMEEYISLLAMASDDFHVLEEAKERSGEHPDHWIPEFLKIRKQRMFASSKMSIN